VIGQKVALSSLVYLHREFFDVTTDIRANSALWFLRVRS